MKSGIYKILNTANGKFYIGSAVNLNKRFLKHRELLENQIHYNKHLQAAFIQYGSIYFEFGVLEYCNKDKLLEREQYWVDITGCNNKDVGYNKKLKVNSNLGLKFLNVKKRTPEQCERMSKARKGIIPTQSQRKAVSEANKKRIGVKYNIGIRHNTRCKCENCRKLKNEKRKLTRNPKVTGNFVMIPNFNSEKVE